HQVSFFSFVSKKLRLEQDIACLAHGLEVKDACGRTGFRDGTAELPARKESIILFYLKKN
ncbi:MAG TPA: hypothetical protein VIJ46_01220, partial [Rhabdochlamydiaceae bacterium]